MKDASPIAIHRSDYAPYAFTFDSVSLHFTLAPNATEVIATSQVHRQKDAAKDAPLVLAGVDLTLVELSIDGQAREGLVPGKEQLIVTDVPDAFTLVIKTRIDPENNKTGEGLYLSGGAFCTQCEAEGFRRITFAPDRPDVMSVYQTKIVADKAKYPVLLSNGNCIESGDLDNGKHFATWEDPFKKPSYLFALVAGELVNLDDTFTTMSGRKVTLRVFVEDGNLDKAGHCMDSLKKAMAWDEKVFGREYDLDIFMIVAVSFFNMGAMENKGLNVFNTKYVLARPDTATDVDFQGVLGVVGHEYFHNWSGNRVTCRDWFQLSLKEGFTVFRDQEFSADMGSRAVKRIEDVRRLRAAQFMEDAGPTAHPIRPDSYQEISNFYTPTIYEKGAEVVRMQHTLLGAEVFRKGSDLYFERHDGHAVTCDDFVSAMEDASGKDLSQFRTWYSQAGTPVVHADTAYDAAKKTFRLTLKQHTDPTPEQPEKKPLHMPVRVGLIGPDGADLPLRMGGQDFGTTALLELTQAEQTFEFEGVEQAPVPSLFRGFSAPIRLRSEESQAAILHRMAHDSDPFNCWEASQTLATGLILDQLSGKNVDTAPFVAAFGTALKNTQTDPALLAHALSLPAEVVLAQEMNPVDVEGLHRVRSELRATLAGTHGALLRERYDALNDDGPYEITPAAIGRRSLRNTLLSYLTAGGRNLELAKAQFNVATNMTDSVTALSRLTDAEGDARQAPLATFLERWKDEALVVDKWFALQAQSTRASCLDEVKALMDHPLFSLENPNRARSLVGAFAMNHLRFHAADGAGYAFHADRICELDAFNPQIAARMVGPLARWQRYDAGRQTLMKQQLQRLLDREGVSKDVREIIGKALA